MGDNMNNFELKLISSYNKCFDNDKVSDFAEMTSGSALKGEFFAFEACMSAESYGNVYVKIKSEISDMISVSLVKSVGVRFPVYATNTDDDYLNEKKPGLYPDLLVPVYEKYGVEIEPGKLTSLWIQADIPENAKAGKYDIEISVCNRENDELASAVFTLDIIDAVLPKQTLINTQWFHCDCLATYYGVPMMSERHWEIIEEFVKTAVKHGQNMLLMPTFTPALDTYVGGERPTMQLVGVTVNADGTYTFDFTLVDRWLEMCDRCGVTHYEIAHTFTQWGAAHAPKVMATVNGEYKKIFGWETDSLSDEYIGFIRAYLVEFKEYMKNKGLLDKCLFHISDEPAPEHLGTYKQIHDKLDDLLTDVTCGDALSNYSFYETGAVKCPIVGTDHITPFLENNVPNLWCYYCCSQHTKVSNRLIAMTMNRTRVIGMQMFKFDIAGFLQWGYNFYYSYHSVHPINPYECNDGGPTNANGDIWVPAGETFCVYPAPDGTPFESLHYKAFAQGLFDMRAMQLAEKLTSKEEVVKLIEDIAGDEILFAKFPSDLDFSEKVRFAVNELIASKI